jgi:hypothetical protein
LPALHTYCHRLSEVHIHGLLRSTINQQNIQVAFGKILRQLRQEAGLTQEVLGFEADLRRTYQ